MLIHRRLAVGKGAISQLGCPSSVGFFRGDPPLRSIQAPFVQLNPLRAATRPLGSGVIGSDRSHLLKGNFIPIKLRFVPGQPEQIVGEGGGVARSAKSMEHAKTGFLGVEELSEPTDRSGIGKLIRGWR